MWANLFLKPITIKTLESLCFSKNLRSIAQNLVPEPDDLKAPNNKRVRNILRSILGITEYNALQLMSNNKKLSSASPSLLTKNFAICIENNIGTKLIIKYPFLLYDQNLGMKIKKLKRLPLDLNITIPLARLGTRNLTGITSNDVGVEQIHHMCKIFDLTPKQACDALSTKPFMFGKILENIEDSLNIFYEYNFTKDDILKDLWVLRYSESHIRNRMNFLKEHDLDILKTWMVRCQEISLLRHVKRESDNKDILGENSVAQYLSKKLNCSEAIAKSLIKKHPQLQNKNLLTMNAMMQMLYKAGFTSLQICKIPKILLHSIETTAQRLKELDKHSMKPHNLYVLTKSQKQYQEYIEGLLKAKSKAENVV